jgi:hypothetical protein
LLFKSSPPRSFAVAAGCVAFVLVGTRAAPVDAAPADGVYVGVGALLDIKRFSGDPATNVLDGNAAGGSISLGAPLGARWDVELGVEVPAVTTDLQPRLVTVRRSTITLQSRTRNRPITVTPLLRYRAAERGRVQVGLLGGVSLVQLRRFFDTDAPADTPASLIPRSHESVDYAMAPMVGVDARVALTAHLAIVPAMRVSMFSQPDLSGVLLRPRVALRWTF